MTLPGQIDLCNAGQVEDALTSAAGQGGTVIADMTATAFCDCAGARAVVQAHIRAAASRAELRVVVTAAPVLRLFDLVGADRVLDIHPSAEAALGRRSVRAGAATGSSRDSRIRAG